MTEQRFLELLASYGADLTRWPEDEIEDAGELLQGASHRVKDLWESERVFDGLLGMDVDPVPSIAMESKVLSMSPTAAKSRKSRSGLRGISFPRWATGATVAASLALGFVAGYASDAPSENEEYAQMLSFNGAGAGAMFLSAMNDSDQN